MKARQQLKQEIERSPVTDVTVDQYRSGKTRVGIYTEYRDKSYSASGYARVNPEPFELKRPIDHVIESALADLCTWSERYAGKLHDYQVDFDIQDGVLGKTREIMDTLADMRCAAKRYNNQETDKFNMARGKAIAYGRALTKIAKLIEADNKVE